MKPAQAVARRGWDARLRLAFELRADRTVLAGRSSFGPLAVQKALYPEGDPACHAILLHPPGGIAGGDRLEIAIDLAPGAKALLTTPGATKWYRSGGEASSQRIGLAVGSGAVCEWMPQENIFFDSAEAANVLAVELDDRAVFCGWDVICLGRWASGERFDHGRIRQHIRISRGARPLFEELGTIEGGGPMLDSPVGMAGFPICGTFIVAGAAIGGQALEFCRGLVPEGDCQWGISAMGELLVARCLARRTETVRQHFLRIWDHLRPHYARTPARIPRIWAT